MGRAVDPDAAESNALGEKVGLKQGENVERVLGILLGEKNGIELGTNVGIGVGRWLGETVGLLLGTELEQTV